MEHFMTVMTGDVDGTRYALYKIHGRYHMMRRLVGIHTFSRLHLSSTKDWLNDLKARKVQRVLKTLHPLVETRVHTVI